MSRAAEHDVVESRGYLLAMLVLPLSCGAFVWLADRFDFDRSRYTYLVVVGAIWSIGTIARRLATTVVTVDAYGFHGTPAFWLRREALFANAGFYNLKKVIGLHRVQLLDPTGKVVYRLFVSPKPENLEPIHEALQKSGLPRATRRQLRPPSPS